MGSSEERALSDNRGLTKPNRDHTEAVPLTSEELSVLVGAMDCCGKLGGQLLPSAPEVVKSARGKLLFAARQAWLKQEGNEEPLSASELEELRAAFLAGRAWKPER